MTAVRRVSHSHGAVLVACKLFTGRTHQIRVHLSWLGLPLVADAVYGGRSSPAIDRQALHAACLQFVHPVTEEFLKFTAPIPPDMNACMAQEGLQMPVDSASPDWFSTLDFGETGAQGDNR
jgi:23S rRNA pseudouridine1911/1915/1917 synthase